MFKILNQVTYCFFLSCLSSVLLAQTPDFSKVPGVVVTHNPASSGKYIGSPSLAILPNGDYVVSHDFFGPKSNEHVSATSRIFHSSNKGKSWKQISVIEGQFWSKLFVHQNALFLMGTNRHHGNTIIRKSVDGGKTWTNPTDAQNGLLKEGEYHCAPMQVISYKGKLWRAMEDATGPPKQWGRRYGPFMMSIPVEADPMIAANWTSSNIVKFDSTYLGGNLGGMLEGNAVIGPDGEILDILRVADASTLEEKAAFVHISADGKTAKLNPLIDFKPLPGGSKKFMIRFDEKSKMYWMITNHIPDAVKAENGNLNSSKIRNHLGLFVSKDLNHWELKKELLAHPDIKNHGFQYIDWLFDGKDILFVSRTAFDDGLGGAHNNHDANFVTFHKIRKFRKTL